MFIPTLRNVIHIRLMFALAALLLALPSCFHPTYDHPACGPGGECPSGMTCDPQSICDVSGGDAPSDASIAPSIDAPLGAPGDTPPASFTPSNGIDPTLAASLTAAVIISANTT
jgi:hypothetical protein